VRDDPNFANCFDLGNLALNMVQTERHKSILGNEDYHDRFEEQDE
jgi:hypothetical protein